MGEISMPNTFYGAAALKTPAVDYFTILFNQKVFQLFHLLAQLIGQLT
jgi:hypothetical protein